MIRRKSWKNNRNLGSMAAVACLLICVGVYLNNVSIKDGAMEMAARDETYVEDTVAEFAMTNGFCAGTDADEAQVDMDGAETVTETPLPA